MQYNDSLKQKRKLFLIDIILRSSALYSFFSFFCKIKINEQCTVHGSDRRLVPVIWEGRCCDLFPCGRVRCDSVSYANNVGN